MATGQVLQPIEALVVRFPGRCKHHRRLSEMCVECEVAWYGRPRFGPILYRDLIDHEHGERETA